VRALEGLDLVLRRGEFLAVVGASGSGKSTLLNLLAGLDTPSEGRIEVEGAPLASLKRRELAAYRAKRIGMVHQSFNLIPHLDAERNVELALLFDGSPRAERRERARAILARLGLAERLDHRPADLSGGEQQRVAIARALVKRPEVLLADEPTGNLDEENTEQIAQLLVALNRQGHSVVLTTHDLDLARRCAHRLIRLQYGRLAGEEIPGTSGGGGP